jgi:hypothetical protein
LSCLQGLSKKRDGDGIVLEEVLDLAVVLGESVMISRESHYRVEQRLEPKRGFD